MANEGNTATQEPSHSYDVFLSFRGQDTRYSFTGNLYAALTRKGLKIFMDDEGLKNGDQIRQSLVNAIRESRLSIVVFSEKYASSRWCLDELLQIVECMRSKNHVVWPIFYKVAPSDVRYQKNSYAEAMAAHEQKLGVGSEKVQNWKSALSEVADLTGNHYETGYEYVFIQKIVETAYTKLYREQLDVGEYIVGHQSRIQELKKLLDTESDRTVCMLGIHGTGGVGKTTLAKALYNSIIHRFECAIFLEHVRERSNSSMGLAHLQEAILCKLFEGDIIKLVNDSDGVTRLKDILRKKRVLLVLDDIDDEVQLEKLAGNCNWFRLGSRIIMTTRDKHLLVAHGVEKRYEMKELNDHEALQLFCWKAFKMNQPKMGYEYVSNNVVHYAGGLPLALKVIGSHLASKPIEQCECALKAYKRTPQTKIQDILRISYDGLEDDAKNVFLDIACFFNGKRLETVENVLKKCDFNPGHNIPVLIDKSLLAVECDRLRMHDLIQDMGREIVRKEAQSKLGERSRLCFHQDVLRVLRENSGSNNIEGIMLDPKEEEEVKWSGNAFEKMKNLRILIVRNTHFTPGPNYLPNSLRLLEWEFYPSNSFPSNFHRRDIVFLDLPCSSLSLGKEKPFPKLEHLAHLKFSECQFITHLPDMSGVSNLGYLELHRCRNLISVHPSVGFLKKIKFLSIFFCTKLEDFPTRMWLPPLQSLFLFRTRIAFLPHIEEKVYQPVEIVLNSDQIKELPDSITNLMGPKKLSIVGENLPSQSLPLPSDFFMLPVREELQLYSYPKFGESVKGMLNCTRYFPLRVFNFGGAGLIDEDLHTILCCFPNLEELYVPSNEFVSLPTSIKESAKLRALSVGSCKRLEEIPELPKSIQQVYARDCPSLSSEASKMLWSQALKKLIDCTYSCKR